MRERMRKHLRIALIGWIVLLGLCGAAQALQPMPLNVHLDGLGTDRSAPTTSRLPIMRLAVQAPGHFASEALSVFKVPIERFFAAPLKRIGLKAGRLRPYLLGGMAFMPIPQGNTVGSSLAGGERGSALHVGAGAELRLRKHAYLTMDFGEIIRSGSLSQESDRRYRFGLLFDF